MTTRSEKALVWLLVFMVIVVPALLTEGFVRHLETTHEAAVWDDARERARDLLSRINYHLDVQQVIRDELLAFSARASRIVRDRGLSAKTAMELDTRLSRLVGPEGFRYWFQPNGSMISLPGERVPGSRRAWEALVRQIAGDQPLSAMDERLATGLSRILFGEIVTVAYLRQARRRVLLLPYEGRRHAIFLLPIAISEDRQQIDLAKRRRPWATAWAFVGVSLENAPKGWEFRRAMQRLSSTEARIGCYWQSRQAGLGSGDLSDNLLDGMVRLLTQGQREFIDGERLLMAEFWQPDPDLLLAVEVRRRRSRLISTILRWGRVFLWGIALVPMLFLIGGFRRSFSWNPDLRLKFLLASVILVGPPILILLLWSGAFLDRQRMMQRGEAEILLERTLIDLERVCGDGLIDIESDLTRLQHERSLIQADSPEQLRAILSRFLPRGLDFAIVFHRDGRTVQFSDVKAHGLRGHIAITYLLAKALLRNQGFQEARLEKRNLLPVGIETLVSSDGIQSSSDLLNRLKLLEVAQFQNYFHSVFLRGENEKAQAFLVTSFHISTLRKYLLERALMTLPPRSQVFWRTTQDVGARREPRNKEIRAMLDRLALLPDKTVRLLPARNGQHPLLILGRPIHSLGIVAATAMNLDVQAQFRQQTKATILLFIVLTSLGATLVSGCLHQALWVPLDTVRKAIRTIDSGDVPPPLKVLSDDELGSLTKSVNRLSEGLKEKAAMLPFLRRELVDRATQPTSMDVDRRTVLVWFAGLRGFSQLERQTSPEATLAVMNAFLGACERSIQLHGGEIDKFIGDTAMAIFPFDPSDPTPLKEPLAAASCLQHAWRKAQRADNRLPSAGVGIAQGTVLAGQIGSVRKRLDFTVIGDTVNIAARLEKLAGRPESSPILIEVSRGSVGFDPPVGWKRGKHEKIMLRGRKEPIEVLALDWLLEA